MCTLILQEKLVLFDLYLILLRHKVAYFQKIFLLWSHPQSLSLNFTPGWNWGIVILQILFYKATKLSIAVFNQKTIFLCFLLLLWTTLFSTLCVLKRPFTIVVFAPKLKSQTVIYHLGIAYCPSGWWHSLCSFQVTTVTHWANAFRPFMYKSLDASWWTFDFCEITDEENWIWRSWLFFCGT